MKLFRKKARSVPLTRTESLACVPQKSPTVTWQALENGEIRLEYPLNIRPFFISLAARWQKLHNERPTRKIELDQMGSIVWRLVDGENNVGKIIKEFSDESRLSVSEAEISVTTFLRELGRRGLILMR